MRKVRASQIEELVFTTVNGLFMAIFVFVMLYPFWNTVAISFNEAVDTIRGGVTFFPRRFSLQNYKMVFSNSSIYNARLTSTCRAWMPLEGRP